MLTRPFVHVLAPAALIGAALLAGCGGSSSAQAPAFLEITSPEMGASIEGGVVYFEVEFSGIDESTLSLSLDGAPISPPIDLESASFDTALVIGQAGMARVDVRATTKLGAPLADFVEFEILGGTGGPAEFPGLSVLHTFAGQLDSDYLGQGADGIGDVNGDGVPDLVVGIPGSDAVAPQCGRVELRSGLDGALINALHGVAGEGAGESVATIGDLDGDGIDDFAFGAPGADVGSEDAGAVIVVSGANGSRLFRFDGEHAGERLGDEVGAVGDINGDGVPDIGGGAREANHNGFRSGRARVWSGADGGLLWQRDGQQPYVQMGVAFDGVGDADGDGIGDFAVGIWGAVDNGGSSGAVIVVSGASGNDLARIPGPVADDHFGVSLAGVGDLDGDGAPEVLIGGIFGSAGGLSGTGYAQLHSCADGRLLRRFDGDQEGMRMGASVDGIGDLDGDGVRDLAVGAPFYDGVRGSLDLFSGRTGERLMRVLGPPTLGLFGGLVRGVGDLDGDGADDFVVGTPLEIVSGEFAGTLRAFALAPEGAALAGDLLLRDPQREPRRQ